MIQLFDTILYIPFFNLLVFLYNTAAFGDFGVAIILLTLIIRAFLSPLSIKAFRTQKILSNLQPQIQEVQEKFKDDSPKKAKEVMELYRQYNVNPFSGCLPLLIQLPILIALYRVSIAGFDENSLAVLYGFIKRPEFLNSVSFGFLDLTRRSFLFSALAGVSQFMQMKISTKTQPVSLAKDKKFNPMSSINRQMLYFFPIITIIISMSFPAGLPLYWIATTAFSIAEQIYINRATSASG